MAIETMAPEFGVFSPQDLDLLQSAYDDATETMSSMDDATMADIAYALFKAYEAGVRNRSQLVDIAIGAFSRRSA